MGLVQAMVKATQTVDSIYSNAPSVASVISLSLAMAGVCRVSISSPSTLEDFK